MKRSANVTPLKKKRTPRKKKEEVAEEDVEEVAVDTEPVTRLGKIHGAYFGRGGIQNSLLGIHLVLSGRDLESGQDWSTSTTQSDWDSSLVECKEGANWTEEDREENYVAIMRFISDLLFKARVNSIEQLAGIPIEAVFQDGTLVSWHVLEECR